MRILAIAARRGAVASASSSRSSAWPLDDLAHLVELKAPASWRIGKGRKMGARCAWPMESDAQEVLESVFLTLADDPQVKADLAVLKMLRRVSSRS